MWYRLIGNFLIEGPENWQCVLNKEQDKWQWVLIKGPENWQWVLIAGPENWQCVLIEEPRNWQWVLNEGIRVKKVSTFRLSVHTQFMELHSTQQSTQFKFFL